MFNTDFPIKIITEWHVSIRPCELNNFAELLNVECSVSRGLNEYKMVMSYLEQNGATLVDIIDYDQREYDSIKTGLLHQLKSAIRIFLICWTFAERFLPASETVQILFDICFIA